MKREHFTQKLQIDRTIGKTQQGEKLQPLKRKDRMCRKAFLAGQGDPNGNDHGGTLRHRSESERDGRLPPSRTTVDTRVWSIVKWAGVWTYVQGTSNVFKEPNNFGF